MCHVVGFFPQNVVPVIQDLSPENLSTTQPSMEIQNTPHSIQSLPLLQQAPNSLVVTKTSPLQVLVTTLPVPSYIVKPINSPIEPVATKQSSALLLAETDRNPLLFTPHNRNQQRQEQQQEPFISQPVLPEPVVAEPAIVCCR